jgi:hypothetical protein
MNRLSVVVFAAGLAAGIPLAAQKQAPENPARAVLQYEFQQGKDKTASTPPAPQTAAYTAHEWGTFTSMVGQDGVALEGLQREEEALPKFVHDLLQIDEAGRTEGKMPSSRVTQKMETPVIYFYADQPLAVRVMVWFQKGLMTQFYPLPAEVYPQLDQARKERIDMSKVDGSALSWDIDVVPHGAPLPKEIPACEPGNPWLFAREVNSACVRTRPDVPGARVEAEHYLFYRGLGRWTPPVELQARAEGKVTLKNGMPGAIPFVALLELDADGGRFQLGKPMAAGAAQAFDLGAVPMQKDRGRVARELGAYVMRALVAQGLFEDEARAMVATWSRSWFQKNGTRAIYLLPRQQVDQVLPLSFDPQPQKLVRVLVGRLEYITPEGQARVEQALRDTRAGDASVRARGEATLHGLDRFLEPQLRNVVAHGSVPEVRKAAAALLATLTK